MLNLESHGPGPGLTGEMGLVGEGVVSILQVGLGNLPWSFLGMRAGPLPNEEVHQTYFQKGETPGLGSPLFVSPCSAV